MPQYDAWVESATFPILWPNTDRCRDYLDEHFPKEADWDGHSLVLTAPDMTKTVSDMRTQGLIIDAERFDAEPKA